jgi:TrmH family RNA methyltransferase
MKLLTLARDLRRRKARERQDIFVAEGHRSVELLLRSKLDVIGILVSGGAR